MISTVLIILCKCLQYIDTAIDQIWKFASLLIEYSCKGIDELSAAYSSYYYIPMFEYFMVLKFNMEAQSWFG